MKICRLHNECTVVHDRLGLLGCPMCEQINELKGVIDGLEKDLDEYEEATDEAI